MYRLKRTLKRIFTPVTIILIPHTSRRTINLKVPSVGLFTALILSFIGTAYVFSVAVDAAQYRKMEEKVDFYASQFVDLKPTMDALKTAERDFRRLFSLKSKEEVLESVNFSDRGAVDMESLRAEIEKTVNSVSEIKEYLGHQKVLYMATPVGYPVSGGISSGFGERAHPITGKRDFHTGVDIPVEPETPVRATADGVISFSGWSGASGNLVVIEHGFGFSTFYAHNKENLVKVGQVVKRGDVISHSGSTGSSTGPHVHYEIWKNGRLADPKSYLSGG
jgi:murein DD-endopeptidase MepM/ murein hydrolase activator NlpD